MAQADSAPSSRLLRGLEATILVVVALYFGRPVLVPVALALLISFLLTPPVSALEHRGLPRVAAVGLVVFMLGCLSVLVAWKTVDQLSELVLNLPAYKENLRDKIQSVRGSSSQTLKSLEKTVSDVTRELEKTSETAQEAAAARLGTTVAAEDAPPTPVRIIPDSPRPWMIIQAAVATLAEPLAQAGIIIVLVIFMLISREDLRNRCLRLAGTGRITLTTRTLDELETRISRYLLMNATVNGGFGLVVGTGLYALGVHYAVLWGFLAAVLRFVPYLGPIVASVLPIGMSVIQSPDWTQPALALGLFVVAELITNNVVEPLTYGRGSGVSTVALLLAAVFWSWIWGPVGLMLSVPLTVVLAVLGKYVAPLEPLWIMLGDEPALPPYVQLYQRLLAGDADEAANVVEEFNKSHSQVEVFDELVVPALVMAERDRGRGQLTEANQQFVWSTTQNLLDEYLDEPVTVEEPTEESLALSDVLVIGVPAADRSDELALDMLGRSIPGHANLQRVGLSALASEVLTLIDKEQPVSVVISALGTGGVGQVRYLCKRISQRFPDLPVLVGRWGYRGDVARMNASLRSRGASQVVTTIREAVEVIQRSPRVQQVQTVNRPLEQAELQGEPLLTVIPTPAVVSPRPAPVKT